MTKLIKHAVVIGATGLVGRTLVNQLNLISSCKKISVIVRKEDEQLKTIDKVEQIILADFLLLSDQDVGNPSHAFSCLGSTLKKAGSKENFYAIDFTMNAHFANLFTATDIHYVLVSAQGANQQSNFYYNRVKGELEKYIESLALACVSIIRPSLLLGMREESRALEDISQNIFKRISNFLPKRFKYKPVTADQVAHTMVDVAQLQTDKFKIYDNLQIQNIK